jgi:hypothetical protein
VVESELLSVADGDGDGEGDDVLVDSIAVAVYDTLTAFSA